MLWTSDLVESDVIFNSSCIGEGSGACILGAQHDALILISIV